MTLLLLLPANSQACNTSKYFDAMRVASGRQPARLIGTAFQTDQILQINPEAQNSPNALRIMVFGPKSLKIGVLRV